MFTSIWFVGTGDFDWTPWSNLAQKYKVAFYAIPESCRPKWLVVVEDQPLPCLMPLCDALRAEGLPAVRILRSVLGRDRNVEIMPNGLANFIDAVSDIKNPVSAGFNVLRREASRVEEVAGVNC